MMAPPRRRRRRRLVVVVWCGLWEAGSSFQAGTRVKLRSTRLQVISNSDRGNQTRSTTKFHVDVGDLDFLTQRVRADVELIDARARADVEKVIESEFCERARTGLVEFGVWATFFVRANAFGLTQDVNLQSSLLERLKVFSMTVDERRKHAEEPPSFPEDDDLRGDWSNIHTRTVADGDDDDARDDFEEIQVRPDEWAAITQTSFEVDTQVVYDTVIQGKWTVKEGKCHFVQASLEDDHLLFHDKDDDDNDDFDDDILGHHGSFGAVGPRGRRHLDRLQGGKKAQDAETIVRPPSVVATTQQKEPPSST